MSRKSKLQSELFTASRRAGGSHETRENRAYFIGAFVRTIFALGFPLQRISQIGVRVIVKFVAQQCALGRSTRTIQNKMSMVRTLLRAAGREQFACDRQVSNRALGLSGASRRGTKVPMQDHEFQQVLARIQDAGLSAILMLEWALGLRCKEAIRSVRSLKTWRTALLAGAREIHVVYGTKGGRPRWVQIVNRDTTLAAIEYALSVVAMRGKLAPKPNLKAALKWYANATNRLGIQGHALRYTFTHCAIRARCEEGHTIREALALVAMSLGHGDGRARMIKSVYGHGTGGLEKV